MEDFAGAGSERAVGVQGDLAPTGTRSDIRQRELLPPGYTPQDANALSFDPRLAFELALGVADARGTFAKYGYSQDQAVALLSDPIFGAKIREYKAEVTDKGLSFKLKAKLQAEDMLTVSYMLVNNSETPAPVRADLIKWTAKMAGLEPTPAQGTGQGSGAFQLSISFAGQDKPEMTISTQRPAIEAEVVEVQ